MAPHSQDGIQNNRRQEGNGDGNEPILTDPEDWSSDDDVESVNEDKIDPIYWIYDLFIQAEDWLHQQRMQDLRDENEALLAKAKEEEEELQRTISETNQIRNEVNLMEN